MITKSIKETIKEHYFKNPSSKLRVRELERLLKIPLPSTIRYVKELIEKQILTKAQTGNVVFYTSNRTSKTFLLEKKLFNLKSLYECGLIEQLITELSNPTIIVFGSYSKGEDLEDGDVDLYVETSSKKEIKLDKFEKIFGRKIQIFKHKNIKEIKNQHLANNIINGINLNGFLEVITWRKVIGKIALNQKMQ